jgi:tetratricopeptide (TPR) repeat protein
LGFAYANLKENKLALDCYSQALKLDPDQQQALLNRAALFHLVGERRKAIFDLKQILLINPGQEQVKLLLKEIESE